MWNWLSQLLHRKDHRQPEGPPIFVRGVSRSGGTLLVTLLDANPDIAMSYEIYPTLLAGKRKQTSTVFEKAEYQGPSTDQIETPVDLDHLIATLQTGDTYRKVAQNIEDRDLKTFVVRCDRGGVPLEQLISLVKQHQKRSLDFSTLEGQMRFMEACCIAKMQRQGKKRWGLKCSSKFEDYLTLWPDAYFINIIRDGRDVLASQLNTGSFSSTPEEVGLAWSNTHQKFHQLAQRQDVNAYELLYEDLARNPELEVPKLCEFLNVPFDKGMLNFHQQDLTIYKANHLSMDRISKPIDTTKIGRWKKELTSEQLAGFYAEANETMTLFGYDTSENVENEQPVLTHSE